MSIDTSDISWVEPPPPPDHSRPQRGADRFHAHLAAALRANPGQWARVRDDLRSTNAAYALASRIRTGTIKAYAPKGAFDAAVVNQTEVRATYVGEVAP